MFTNPTSIPFTSKSDELVEDNIRIYKFKHRQGSNANPLKIFPGGLCKKGLRPAPDEVLSSMLDPMENNTAYPRKSAPQ